MIFRRRAVAQHIMLVHLKHVPYFIAVEQSAITNLGAKKNVRADLILPNGKGPCSIALKGKPELLHPGKPRATPGHSQGVTSHIYPLYNPAYIPQSSTVTVI